MQFALSFAKLMNDFGENRRTAENLTESKIPHLHCKVIENCCEELFALTREFTTPVFRNQFAVKTGSDNVLSLLGPNGQSVTYLRICLLQSTKSCFLSLKTLDHHGGTWWLLVSVLSSVYWCSFQLSITGKCVICKLSKPSHRL